MKNFRVKSKIFTKNPDNYDVKYMKIKFNWDDELLLSKLIKTSSMTIVVRPIFVKITNIIHSWMSV